MIISLKITSTLFKINVMLIEMVRLTTVKCTNVSKLKKTGGEVKTVHKPETLNVNVKFAVNKNVELMSGAVLMFTSDLRKLSNNTI